MDLAPCGNASKPTGQTAAHLDVQVIGGLIQDQHIWLCHERCRQRYPAPLSTRHCSHAHACTCHWHKACRADPWQLDPGQQKSSPGFEMPRRFRELVASCSKSQFPAVSSSSAAEASSSMLSVLCMLCEAWHSMHTQLHMARCRLAFMLQASQTQDWRCLVGP